VVTAKLLGASIRDTESQLVPFAGEADCDIGKPLTTFEEVNCCIAPWPPVKPCARIGGD
jgi:hypothetical protein